MSTFLSACLTISLPTYLSECVGTFPLYFTYLPTPYVSLLCLKPSCNLFLPNKLYRKFYFVSAKVIVQTNSLFNFYYVSFYSNNNPHFYTTVQKVLLLRWRAAATAVSRRAGVGPRGVSVRVRRRRPGAMRGQREERRVRNSAVWDTLHQKYEALQSIKIQESHSVKSPTALSQIDVWVTSEKV